MRMRLPAFYARTTRLNHSGEDLNQRLNYPIKRALIEMENNDEVDMGSETTKFCVSWVTIRVMNSHAWNSHRIPGPDGGIPDIIFAQNNHVTSLPPNAIPSTQEVVRMHEQDGYNDVCH